MSELTRPLESECLDCGTSLDASHCPTCGQSAHSPVQPLATFVKEGLSELFSLEGRLWRGVWDLVTRPGHLTAEYWRGRRTRHIHPTRLFLVSGAVAYFGMLFAAPERPGLLRAIVNVVAGEGGGWQALVMVATILLSAAAAQRLVYAKTGRVFVEHLVLVLHAVSFGMLLAPIETLLLQILPWDWPGIEAMMAPVILVYWTLTLREVFEESVATTLVRAGAVFSLGFVFLIAVMAVVEELLLPVILGLR